MAVGVDAVSGDDAEGGRGGEVAIAEDDGVDDARGGPALGGDGGDGGVEAALLGRERTTGLVEIVEDGADDGRELGLAKRHGGERADDEEVEAPGAVVGGAKADQDRLESRRAKGGELDVFDEVGNIKDDVVAWPSIEIANCRSLKGLRDNRVMATHTFRRRRRRPC